MEGIRPVKKNNKFDSFFLPLLFTIWEPEKYWKLNVGFRPLTLFTIITVQLCHKPTALLEQLDPVGLF